MTLRHPLVLVLAILLATASPGIAQDRNERQVALLPAEGLMEVTPELRNRLGLFPEVSGFVRARLFEGAPGPMVLEIERREGGELRRERRELDAGALAEFRADLTAALDALETRTITTREGRGGLVLGQTLLGLAYHGWAIPVALDIDSSQAAVGTYLLTAGAHFYLPYRLTRDRTVTDAHRNFTWYGGTRGIGAGVLLVAGAQGREPEGSTGRARLGGGSVMGAAGSLAAFHAVDRWRPDEGTAALWGLMGDHGFATGAALAYILGPYATEDVEVDPGPGGLPYTESRTRNAPAGHFMTVAGGGLGLVGGHLLGNRREYTPGNASALRTTSILGAQSGMTLTRLVGVDDGRTLMAGTLAGGLAGTWGGDHLLRGLALSDGEGLLINAGHIAGGALALGLTYLVVDEMDERERLYLSTSTAGSLLGAGLVWRAVADDASRDIRGSESRVRVSVDPTALLADVRRPLPPLVTIRF